MARTREHILSITPPPTGDTRRVGIEKLDLEMDRVFSFLQNDDVINVKDFGAKGDGTTDDTAAILTAKAYVISKLPSTLYFPKGIFCYTNLGNLAYTGLTITGEGDRQTVLKCTNTTSGHSAILIDAFPSGTSETAPFIQRCNLKNITVQGNSLTAIIFDVQGIARSAWENVIAREAESTGGIAFNFKGIMLNRFANLICSTDLDNMTNIPSEGLKMSAGTRAGQSIGNSSNNVFISPYFEGMPIGIRLSGADQNVFIGGSPESCSYYGLVISALSRYNTFLGTAFENPNSTADISDGGVLNKFINIYAAKNLILQGKNSEVSGGYFERIEIQSGAVKNKVHDIVFNHWNTGSGGFIDGGTATEWSNLYNEATGSYIYPYKDRKSITVTATPFSFTNNTGQYIEVIITAGTIIEITQSRNGDAWLKPISTPGCHLLSPGDTITVKYSASPTMSYIVHN